MILLKYFYLLILSLTTCSKFHLDTIYRSKDMMILVKNCGCVAVLVVWHPDMDSMRCGLRTTHGATGVVVQGTPVLYEEERRTT